jgi:hypothetical protein
MYKHNGRLNDISRTIQERSPQSWQDQYGSRQTRPNAVAWKCGEIKCHSTADRETLRSLSSNGKTGDPLKDQGSARRDQVNSESRLAKAQKLQIRSR